jgi:hypothetical protein
LKSKHSDAAVPPLDETLKTITEPDPDLLSANKNVVDAFCKSFELKEHPRVSIPEDFNYKHSVILLPNLSWISMKSILIAAEEIKQAIVARKTPWPG